MVRQLFARTTTASSSSPPGSSPSGGEDQDHAFQLLLKAVAEHRALGGSGGSVGRAAAKAARARRALLVQPKARRSKRVRLKAPVILRPLPEDAPLARSSPTQKAERPPGEITGAQVRTQKGKFRK